MYDEGRIEAQMERAARRGGSTSTVEGAGAVFMSLLVLMLGFALFQAIKQGVAWGWPRITAGVVSYRLQIFTALLVLAIGSLFFWFRQVRPTYYGIGEIGFGMALGVSAAFPPTHPDGDFQIAFGVIGAVYLVVRGLDNATRRVREKREREKRTLS